MHVHIDFIGADLYGFRIVYHRYAVHLGHPGRNIGAVHGIGIGTDKEGIQLGDLFHVHGEDELYGMAHALSHISAFYHSRDLLRAAQGLSIYKYAQLTQGGSPSYPGGPVAFPSHLLIIGSILQGREMRDGSLLRP